MDNGDHQNQIQNVTLRPTYCPFRNPTMNPSTCQYQDQDHCYHHHHHHRNDHTVAHNLHHFYPVRRNFSHLLKCWKLEKQCRKLTYINNNCGATSSTNTSWDVGRIYRRLWWNWCWIVCRLTGIRIGHLRWTIWIHRWRIWIQWVKYQINVIAQQFRLSWKIKSVKKNCRKRKKTHYKRVVVH